MKKPYLAEKLSNCTIPIQLKRFGPCGVKEGGFFHWIEIFEEGSLGYQYSLRYGPALSVTSSKIILIAKHNCGILPLLAKSNRKLKFYMPVPNKIPLFAD